MKKRGREDGRGRGMGRKERRRNGCMRVYMWGWKIDEGRVVCMVSLIWFDLTLSGVIDWVRRGVKKDGYGGF